MRDYDGGRFRRLAAGGPACVVETRAIDEFHVCVGLPEIFDLFLDFDILAFPEFFDVRDILAIGRAEVADEAIVELDRVEERRGHWDVAAREFPPDRTAVEITSRAHPDFSHQPFLRRRPPHRHPLRPAPLALPPPQ